MHENNQNVCYIEVKCLLAEATVVTFARAICKKGKQHISLDSFCETLNHYLQVFMLELLPQTMPLTESPLILVCLNTPFCQYKLCRQVRLRETGYNGQGGHMLGHVDIY